MPATEFFIPFLVRLGNPVRRNDLTTVVLMQMTTVVMSLYSTVVWLTAAGVA